MLDGFDVGTAEGFEVGRSVGITVLPVGTIDGTIVPMVGLSEAEEGFDVGISVIVVGLEEVGGSVVIVGLVVGILVGGSVIKVLLISNK